MKTALLTTKMLIKILPYASLATPALWALHSSWHISAYCWYQADPDNGLLQLQLLKVRGLYMKSSHNVPSSKPFHPAQEDYKRTVNPEYF